MISWIRVMAGETEEKWMDLESILIDKADNTCQQTKCVEVGKRRVKGDFKG